MSFTRGRRWLLACVLLALPRGTFGFGLSKAATTIQHTLVNHGESSNEDRSTITLFASEDDEQPSDEESSTAPLCPVLTKIAGVNWEGSCRYVNGALVPASFELTGGIRFDLSPGENTANIGYVVEMNSFVVFPNGKSREIEMRYVENKRFIIARRAFAPTTTKSPEQIPTNTQIQLITSILAPV